MTGPNIILKFKNGATVELPTKQRIPEVFCATFPEQFSAWFVVSDELPSGRLVCKEVSREQAQQLIAE